MEIVYMSWTGNVKDFVSKLNMTSHHIDSDGSLFEMNDDYIIVVPTYVGYINEEVSSFIEYKNNKEKLVGFAGSGNRNFDDLYCINAIELSEKYEKPLILKFEYKGTDDDIKKFKEEVAKIERTKTN